MRDFVYEKHSKPEASIYELNNLNSSGDAYKRMSNITQKCVRGTRELKSSMLSRSLSPQGNFIDSKATTSYTCEKLGVSRPEPVTVKINMQEGFTAEHIIDVVCKLWKNFTCEVAKGVPKSTIYKNVQLERPAARMKCSVRSTITPIVTGCGWKMCMHTPGGTQCKPQAKYLGTLPGTTIVGDQNPHCNNTALTGYNVVQKDLAANMHCEPYALQW
jgi:hypothetical protein